MTDFDAYWSAVDDELARYPAAPELELSPPHKTDYATVYHLKLTSIGPYRLFGYYSVPVGNGPFPGLYLTPRYGSVNHVPHPDDRRRYAVLQLMHRGQRLADKPFAAAYPGLLTLGIADPATYIYRSIVADCLRGAELLLARPEVDTSRVGIRGDDLALLTAARRPGFKSAEIAGLMFYRLLEAAARTDNYPVEEINDHLRGAPGDRDAIAHTLSHFDPIAHAARVKATTLLSVGDPDSIGGPEWLASLIAALGGTVEQYPVTHEGATDHDWIDAWTANQLGTPPHPRLWPIAGD
jgi:cephalosporin-C deacetylase-like acetyl esterase